ncbi:uncharacterized protein SETTUDRAFT_39385 [Exserohilum turcica Et28A]|uniref:Uncharacterized protein n=1 Tax=Exserohilum turcicum (strain 28A) TaxID=671987 RepID=R0K3F3_EXST2|nr:uncharacterized protein SETTUDRAFT_39385 [Exserohilum turcica Et28A]EOA87603.1 hypothetical protein SETTUDRAFT_39385 [Exserohilum turcica Et28A]
MTAPARVRGGAARSGPGEAQPNPATYLLPPSLPPTPTPTPTYTYTYTSTKSSAPPTSSQAIQSNSIVLNAWPRVAGHRGVAMMGLCLLWSMCLEEEDNEEDEEAGREQAGQIKAAVQETVGMLDAAMQSAEQADVVETWRREKQDLVARQPGFGDMFGECVEQAEV